ncbi:hypothetical protein B0H15DRAFT_379358 [Mycena belliarum]|uniref:Uncharacterized protein n=1 Tax=Mycena belliarum TaxID=1033014 RepID=A0AAD6TZN9_9AGAR|nr:hypothetical protein B0H15DRAFT_379358 [Mycena belliae]
MRADRASHVHRRAARSVHRLVARGGGESHGHVLYPCPATTTTRRPSCACRRLRVLEASEAGTAVCTSQTGSLASAAVLESARAAASPTPPRSDAGSRIARRSTSRGHHPGPAGSAAIGTCDAGPCAGSHRLPDAQSHAPPLLWDAWDVAAEAPGAPFDAEVRARRLRAYTARPVLEKPGHADANGADSGRTARRSRPCAPLGLAQYAPRCSKYPPVSVCGVARTCASRPAASSETIAFF